ncbi:MAG TPA: hypothetical protein VMF03_07510 [Steroidobacteraceae bacterium]|nr:hypothetical protein [Steroidobacteraceae bacterium]
MAPQSNPEASPPESTVPAADSPSADDLLALIPDMELLESSALDAHAAHIAFAASASGRKATHSPTLSDPTTPSTRNPVSVAVVNDDPYADLMPDLEAFEDTVPATQSVPALQSVPSLKPPPAPASRPQPQPAPKPAPIAPAAAGAPARTAAPPPPKPVAPAPRLAATSRKAPDPANVPVPPVMDRDFIARNRIVELYLSGRLPVRGATVFEKFCRENPQILDEIGLPERVHAGLRLLEASGKPEPWQEKPKPFWDRPYLPLALAVLVVVLGTTALVLNGRLSQQTRKAAALQKQVIEQPLDAAASTAAVDIQPTHAGPAAAIATVIGGATAQLVNIRIDMTHSDYRAFRVTIDRLNQGRVAVLNNLIKDSNNELGFAINSSALGAGEYRLTIEGLDWRGDPQPDSWAALSLRH